MPRSEGRGHLWKTSRTTNTIILLIIILVMIIVGVMSLDGRSTSGSTMDCWRSAVCLISDYSWAEVAQPSDNILKEQFSKQYHGILKLDSITLKNLDSRGNQATWSAEGDISSREDMYTGVGMAADYYFVEKTWTKDRPVKFSAMLTSKGMPASGWTVSYYSLQMAASDQGRAIDDIKTNDKYLIVNSDDFNYRFGNIEAPGVRRKRRSPVLKNNSLPWIRK